MSRRLHRQKAAELLSAARSDVGMTLVELANAIGVEPELVAMWERGDAYPDETALAKARRATRLRPSIPLALFADDILLEAEHHHVVDVRVFGSAVRGHDTERSDIDLLVGTTSDTSLFGLGAFVLAVEELTGFPVDVLTDDLRGDPHFEHVLAEAVPL
ncbi:nucleotidyltransferase domain-containing protein [Curtobacterium luteum]|uniref:nucleotidyltransferase domain-containing protein n=1 Tax=Curtobacterium luteum TaxID=33881 RepID=UPI00382DEF1A